MVDGAARFGQTGQNVSHIPATDFWCIRCERVYPAIWWIDHGGMCLSPGCQGTLDEASAWGQALLMEHADWPEVGERYEV